MDFFTQQAHARKQTKKLVFYMFLAVLCITLAINIIFYFALNTQEEQLNSLSTWLRQPYWIYITSVTLGIILLTSLFRSWQINSDPESIIRMVNATPIAAQTSNPQEKQLVNIVEEMAIASGMPIPTTYIMKNEQGINAFVSGLTPSNAILVVTQGLLDTLNRSQLQGVIGHEYSHILNGDMRLNIRLMGVIAGILVIGQIGQSLLRGAYYSGGHTRSRGKRSEGGGMVAIAIGIFVVGYIGLFFGRIIKSAVSRQREFLADASAVQFTRDRSGIAGALLSIKTASEGSYLVVDKAEEMSHMCFGSSTKISQFFSNLFASHPPLDERIQAVYPGYLRMQKSKTSDPKGHQQTTSANTQSNFTSSDDYSDNNPAISEFASSSTGSSNRASTGSLVASSQQNNSNAAVAHSSLANDISQDIGKITPDHLQKAEQIIATFDQGLLAFTRGEKALKNSLLSLTILFALANKLSLQDLEQLKRSSKASIDTAELDDVSFYFDKFQALDIFQRHALFNIALKRLEALSDTDKKSFVSQLKKLLPSANKLTAMGLAIFATINNKVNKKRPYQSDINQYKKVTKELNIIFCQILKDNDYEKAYWDDAQQHLKQILKGFGVKAIPREQQFNANHFHQVLNQLARLNPMLKRGLVLSVTDAIQVDNQIDPNEYAYLRLLCEYLDCPIPLN